MKWFKRWFANMCREAWESARYSDEPQLASNKTRGLATVSSRDEERPWGDGLRLNVKRVSGGSVVTFFRYDHKTDRNDDRHYIITDDVDFNTELAKLITMESMR
jgi:hypothetical protein